MLKRPVFAATVLALAAAPLAAQPPAAPPAEQGDRPNLEGEAIGYLAVPALLVLVVLIGVLVGSGGEDDMPVSP